MFDLVEWIIGALILSLIALLGFVVWVAIQDANSPTFELKKSEWHCTSSETHTHLQPMVVGKVTTMMPMTTTECMAYARIGGKGE